MCYLWIHFTLFRNEIIVIVSLATVDGLVFVGSFLCAVSETNCHFSVGVVEITSSCVWTFFSFLFVKLQLTLRKNIFSFVFFSSRQFEVRYLHLLMYRLIHICIIFIQLGFFLKHCFILWFIIHFLISYLSKMLFRRLIIFVKDFISHLRVLRSYIHFVFPHIIDLWFW